MITQTVRGKKYPEERLRVSWAVSVRYYRADISRIWISDHSVNSCILNLRYIIKCYIQDWNGIFCSLFKVFHTQILRLMICSQPIRALPHVTCDWLIRERRINISYHHHLLLSEATSPTSHHVLPFTICIKCQIKIDNAETNNRSSMIYSVGSWWHLPQ